MDIRGKVIICYYYSEVNNCFSIYQIREIVSLKLIVLTHLLTQKRAKSQTTTFKFGNRQENYSVFCPLSISWKDFCRFQFELIFLVLFVRYKNVESFIFVILHNSTVPLQGKVALKFKLQLRNVPPKLRLA